MTDDLEAFFTQRPSPPLPSDRASQATIPRRSRRESEGRCRHHVDVLCSCR